MTVSEFIESVKKSRKKVFLKASHVQYIEPEVDDRGRRTGKAAVQTNVFARNTEVRSQWDDEQRKVMPRSNKTHDTVRIVHGDGFALVHTERP